MKIYLDACCLNRPFDDQRQPRIRLEAEAISLILQNFHQRKWEWIGSDILVYELGPAGAIRFIQQYESGHGDYTRNRKKLCRRNLSVRSASRS